MKSSSAATAVRGFLGMGLMCGASSLAISAFGATAANAAALPGQTQQTDQSDDQTTTGTTDQSKKVDRAGITGGPTKRTQSATNQTTTDTGKQAPAEIVVTGIRASLQSAQSLKQKSDVIGDSITAEDIGALPDRSVTEALQRVPGVSISHFAAGNDPDHFSTEGSGVVIRGLTYTRSELNGRDTFSANAQRGLSFADVPSELLAGVDVFKSPSAEMIEGGIAGTVNLRTRVPFDSKGLLVAGSLEMNYGNFVKKSAPSVSVLASDRWQTPIGEFGILGSFVRSEVVSRADSVQISNWGERRQRADGTYAEITDPAKPGDKIVYIPRGAAERSQHFDRTRYGYSAAAQWRSNDRSMTATFQFLRSDSRERWTEHSIEVATDNVTSNGDSQPLPGTTFKFDDDNTLTDGTITAPNGYRADQNTAGDNRTPANGLQSNNIVRGNNSRYVTSDYSGNFKWQATDRLGVNLDYQHVYSTVNDTDLTVWASTFQNAALHLHGDDVATVNLLPLTNQGDTLYLKPPHDSYLDPYNTFYRSAMDHIEKSNGHEDAARIDLDYSFPETDWIESIRAGYRFSDRQNNSRSTTYNWGVLSEIWGGGGPVWFDDPVNGDPNKPGGSPGPSEPFFYPNFFRGEVPSPAGAGRLFAPANLVLNYNKAAKAALQIGDEWRSRLGPDGCPQNWVPLAMRCGVVAGTPFLPGEISPVHERTNDAYFETRINRNFDNGWDLSGNIGVRYTHTDRTADGNIAFPQNTVTCPTPDPGQPVSVFCALGPAVLKAVNGFENGNVTPVTRKTSYDYFLPSINAKLAVGGGLQFRFAINRAISAPNFSDTRAYYNVNLSTSSQTILANGAPVGIFQVGNPYLKPTVAHNYDLTAEWYFSKVGQLSLALFKKDLFGVATTGLQKQSFTNNGYTFGAYVTTPLNATDVGHVKGLEFSYQQTYDFLPGVLSGLGLSGNFTYVDSNGVSNSTIDADDPNVASGVISAIQTGNLPLQGLSKYQFNIAPFYTYKGIEARVAYSWRSRYLLTTRDVIVPFEPVYNDPYGQLDASIFYAISPHIRMGFQAVNLTNAISETEYVINNDGLARPRNWFINDTRFTFSIRARFGG